MTTRSYPHLPKLYLTRAQRSQLGLVAGTTVELDLEGMETLIVAEVLMPARSRVDGMNAEGAGTYVALDGEESALGTVTIARAIEAVTGVGLIESGGIDVAAPDAVEFSAEPTLEEDPDEDDDYNWRTGS